MIGIAFVAALFGYVVLSAIVLYGAFHIAKTDKGRKRALFIALFIVLWFPAIEPALSYVVFWTYAFTHAKTVVIKVIENADSIRVESYYPENVNSYNDYEQVLANKVAHFGNYYERLETQRYDGVRVEILQNNEVHTISSYQSRFIVKWYKNLETRYFSVYRAEIIEADGGVIAYCNSVTWHGGGIMRLTFAGTTTFATIPSGFSYATFVHSVLRPSWVKSSN